MPPTGGDALAVAAFPSALGKVSVIRWFLGFDSLNAPARVVTMGVCDQRLACPSRVYRGDGYIGQAGRCEAMPEGKRLNKA